jgi:ABC-type amino acid transport system permease subunit
MAGPLLLIGSSAAAVLVALLFLAAGVDKLRHRALLPGVIANYRLLPAWLVQPAAAALPVAELVIAAGLLLALFLPLGVWPALAAAALLLLFAGAMAINIVRGRRHIDCGCGHAGLSQQLGWGQVLRNVVLAGALGVALVPGAMAPGAAGAELLMAMVAGLAGWLLLRLFERLRALAVSQPGRARA